MVLLLRLSIIVLSDTLTSPAGRRSAGPSSSCSRSARSASRAARDKLQVQFLQLLFINDARRAKKQLFGLLIEREGRDFADIRRVGQQHDDAVNARRDSAMRRGPILKGSEHAAKTLFEHASIIASDLERP